MLVLTRQTEESIMIGDDVEIVIVGINGNRVRLGINAPRRIPVHRKEVYETIQREKSHGIRPRGTHTIGKMPGRAAS